MKSNSENYIHKPLARLKYHQKENFNVAVAGASLRNLPYANLPQLIERASFI